MNYDLFGNEIEEKVLLREKFIEPPFSIIDTKQGRWQDRKKKWKSLGIKSELGRDAAVYNMKDWSDKKRAEGSIKGIKLPSDTSIFDPALCEVLYKWFCKDGGDILDPFAGGSVRGIVANYLNYNYTGIELRAEQVESNRDQAMNILAVNRQPNWYEGDSNKILDDIKRQYDFILSCPPYFNLEKYSNLPDDISNMNYADFLSAYESIIKKSCVLLKSGCYACFVVGEIRDKQGNYIGFVPDTIRAFQKCGMEYYNEAILLSPPASASIRANGNMKTNKLVKVHQNILVFKKC